MKGMAIGLLLLLAVGLTGCETLQQRGADKNGPGEGEQTEGIQAPVLPETGLPLAVEQRFKDIPLPAELREDMDRTYVFESANLQIGRMVYTSRASVNDLAQFFIKECPAAQWQLDSALQADGGVKLVFNKPGKRLRIEITPQGIGRPQLLVINLTPEEEASN